MFACQTMIFFAEWFNWDFFIYFCAASCLFASGNLPGGFVSCLLQWDVEICLPSFTKALPANTGRGCQNVTAPVLHGNAENCWSLVVVSSSTFSVFYTSSSSSLSFRTVVNGIFDFQKKQSTIFQSCQGALSAYYAWNVDFSLVMNPHLSCSALLLPPPQALCLREVFQPTLIPSSCRMEIKSLPLMYCLKLSITQETPQGSYCSFYCVQIQDHVQSLEAFTCCMVRHKNR